MNDVAAPLTVPDIALQCLDGSPIDPADFRGQNLLVFFCPSDPAAAAREIEEFGVLARDFADAGVWILGVLEGPIPRRLAKQADPHIQLAQDSDGCAWSHFEPVLRSHGKPDRFRGAALLFERWGSLREAWPCGGHARDALEAARARG